MLTVLNVAYPFAAVSRDSVGGAEQVLSAVDEALVEAGHQSLVLAAQGSQVRGELVAVELPEGPLDGPRRAQVRARYRAELTAVLATRRIDVVHFHGVDCDGYLPVTALPLLVTLHLPLDYYDRTLFDRVPTPAFVCVSDAQRVTFERAAPIRATIDNGIDLANFRPGTGAGGYLACLGRICEEKAYHLALRAAHAADVPLRLAGQVFPYGEHQRYFSERIAPLLDDRRTFVGAVGGDEKRRFLANAAALVVPSRVAETSSLVTMEALASGTPAIVSSAGALPTLIEPDVTGLVADDEDALIAAFRSIRRLSRAACRLSAERRFDVCRTTVRYLRLYAELARAGGSEHRSFGRAGGLG